MKVNITPVAGKLLIKINKEAEQTKSGIQLVKKGELWQRETVLAEVVAVPQDSSKIEPEVGSVVVISGHAGRWIDPELVNDDEYLYRIIDQEEIIAKVDQEVPVDFSAGLGIMP